MLDGTTNNQDNKLWQAIQAAPTHTPGPWKYESDIIDPDTMNTAPEVQATLPNGDTRYICRMFGTNENVIEESRANARLIAAAPDMLDALKAMLSRFADHAQYDDEDAAVIDSARRAIAAATH